MGITKSLFGNLPDGRQVYEYTLVNASGAIAKILDYGATVREIRVPDRNGNFADVVAGYDTLDSYLNADGYQGAVIGRVGNRICKGRFELDGKEYKLFVNNGPNHLHGGEFGFNAKLWSAEVIDEKSVAFSYVSPDGEEGYPGTLKVKVTYSLAEDNALSINYLASTDKRTPVNLTNHTYFNLGGYDSGSIHSHSLFVDAEHYLPTDDTLIPTGEIRSVKGTPFDFTIAKEVGRDIDSDCEDLKIAGGYDHCFFFGDSVSKEPVRRAELYDVKSGRLMEMYTNQPCVQIYTGNFVNNADFPFKNGVAQRIQTLICLETQKMPDSINHSNFTNVVLSPDQTYDYTTIYKFSVR